MKELILNHMNSDPDFIYKFILGCFVFGILFKPLCMLIAHISTSLWEAWILNPMERMIRKHINESSQINIDMYDETHKSVRGYWIPIGIAIKDINKHVELLRFENRERIRHATEAATHAHEGKRHEHS